MVTVMETTTTAAVRRPGAGFSITTDRISEELGEILPDTRSQVGRTVTTMGFGKGMRHDELLTLLRTQGDHFRMYDDDGEHYFSGYLLGDDADGFEPLDLLGRSYGCTDIRYKSDGYRSL